MEYKMGDYEVAVIGAGHAGIEAALAAARLGAKTAIFTMSLDAIGNMPCNPSIGGTAKGHLVREIDALGGEMGKAADATFLQSRMLNRGKGPAVHSLRVQSDRDEYHKEMKHRLELQDGLDIIQAEVCDIRTDENGAVKELVTKLGAVYEVKTAIICSGTFLHGRIYVGDVSYESGPDGLHAAIGLSEALERLGIHLRRFKTGTPARVRRDSIDYSKLEVQAGDEPIIPFSFETPREGLKNQVVCHIAYTNEKTHQIIRDNIHRSPLYGGMIEGVGPRYCPSIEDKVMRFSEKPRHQSFVEPVGLHTEEMYLQGLSSSLPEDVQVQIYRSIVGFENVKIMRNAYAIEYDCIDPLDLKASLEFLKAEGLYGAGQFNGTSGYEEAAAQGLIAGINAARKVQGKEPVILDRASSYIGTLIDDLVTKGCSDPYRMMTSRSEYRLLLRQDNADQRLTPIGHEIGLISEERWQHYLHKQELIEQERKRIEKLTFGPSKELNEMLESRGTAPMETGAHASDLIRRPQVSYKDLEPFDTERPHLPDEVTEQVEIQIKYEGYIQKQLIQVEQMRRLETRKIPEDINYEEVRGLRLEAIEKLQRIRPHSIGQASRISGVSPADISVLLIYMESCKEK
ncbi:tRNA uridine-5-carboxymethylaminomethyl(34) synthesis enzyme MnmG [Negativibacillus massiliensis]|uniref:tRNA uridine-5-carboxymethylaminomethyl(34) synthesis enzyme MnmG n=1 Tax=Negativibacillus massiliensis TaxID=1871035 RepID=UPI002A80CBDB|nr:tRNA uridine-5-carboxymethylaminomethyl(34) synthesis enzyme MnmG [Negativibacillus massiliensis]MDY4048329.1 tRNA uridine-5-carboxymethylaminomethyl(34) synthesis enzyme MnmG [Negativibacillus massiliensis]